MTTGLKILIGLGVFLGVRHIATTAVDSQMFKLGNTSNDIIKVKQAIAYFEGRGDATAVAMLKPRLESLQAKDLSVN